MLSQVVAGTRSGKHFKLSDEESRCRVGKSAGQNACLRPPGSTPKMADPHLLSTKYTDIDHIILQTPSYWQHNDMMEASDTNYDSHDTSASTTSIDPLEYDMVAGPETPPLKAIRDVVEEITFWESELRDIRKYVQILKARPPGLVLAPFIAAQM